MSHDIASLQKVISRAVWSVTKGAASKDDIQDMVQEVNIAMLSPGSRSLKSFDPSKGTKLETWVYMIARSVCVDTIRTNNKKSLPKVYLHDGGDFPQNSGPHSNRLGIEDRADSEGKDPLALLLESEQRGKILTAMEQLSKADRDFLIMMFSDGDHSSEEMALQLGINIKTVYSRKHKLVRKLARLLSSSRSS